MRLVVQKFGGSSLATPRHIQDAARRISQLKSEGNEVVVVVSAMGHTTDHLIRLAKKTVKEPNTRELDMLVSVGERISMSLLAMALHELGIPAISLTGSQSGIITTNEHTEARILEIRPQRILHSLENGKVVIVAGFQGVSLEKEITTLGRGGSDTSAVALAAALKADRCEILTDVKGLFTADPKIVPNARLIPHCNYETALEMARLGAKMHSRSIEVAKRHGVRISISSSHLMNDEKTVIESAGEEKMESTIVRGITTRNGFRVYETENPLDLENLSIWFLQMDGKRSRCVIEDKNCSHGTPVTLVSIVGDGLSPRMISQVLGYARDLKVNPLFLNYQPASLSLAVAPSDAAPLAQKLHENFIE